MAKIPLSLAIGEYDHVRDVLDGTVPVPGFDLTVLRLPVEEMFYRFIVHGEFDVAEVSLAKVVAFAAQDDLRFVPLPVFPSRVFRHSSIYVRTDGAVTRPEQLAGKPASIRECLEAVFPAIPYCVDLIGGPFLEGTAAAPAVFRPKPK